MKVAELFEFVSTGYERVKTSKKTPASSYKFKKISARGGNLPASARKKGDNTKPYT